MVDVSDVLADLRADVESLMTDTVTWTRAGAPVTPVVIDPVTGLPTKNPDVTVYSGPCRRYSRRLQPAMRQVTSKGALNVKNAAKASILAQTSHHFVKQYPNSITYTVTESTGMLVSAEIGPNKERPQGALGNILEYGTSRNPPYPHLGPSLDAEADPYEQFLGDAARDAIFGEDGS